MSDALIKEKLRFFSMSVGSPDSHLKANNTSWLEKFKQKNGLMGSKSRKNSVVDESEGPSLPGSGTQTPSNISPTSPPPPGGKENSPSAMSISKGEEQMKMESPGDSYAEFAAHGGPYRSLSNASLASAFDEAQSSPFSPGPQSPTSPFFTADSASPFMSQQSRMPLVSSSSYSRPRSQTFPMIGIEPGSYVSPPSSEPLTPKYVSSTALESPGLSEMPPSLSSVDEMHEPTSTMQPPPQPMVSSVPPHGMPLQALITHGHQHSSPITPNSAIGSLSPGSPSLEDTRRALEVVMNFFQLQQPGLVEPQEYVMMGKLMEKLKLHPSQLGGEMPGGMHRIPSGDFNAQGYLGKPE